MKLLVLVLSTMVAFSASADSRTQDAKRAFNKMGAVEAYNSKMFSKRVASIGLPGTSTWVKGTSLCKAGNMIRTKTASYKQVCSVWTYRNNDGEKRTTTSAATANRKDARCITKVNGAKLESPINFVKEVTVWGAKKNSEILKSFGKARIFSSYSKANDKGTPVSLGTKSVHVTVPTTYKVDFFADRKKDDLVGSHVFGVANCR